MAMTSALLGMVWPLMALAIALVVLHVYNVYSSQTMFYVGISDNFPGKCFNGERSVANASAAVDEKTPDATGDLLLDPTEALLA